MNAFVRALDPIEVMSAFADALRDAGFRLKGQPVMDGRWHRAPVDDDKGRKTSGRYRGYLDGWPAGFIENFKDNAATGPWKYQGADTPRLSAADRDALTKAKALAEATRARETAALLDKIAAKSVECLDRAPPAPPDHPYLIRKHISADGLRVDDKGRLLVPMFAFDGRLRCVQAIAPDGEKRFPWGSQVHGGLHLLLGEIQPGGVLLIAEGFATAATLRDANIQGAAVAAAFTTTNLVAVARHYGERFPGLRIVFAADNDAHLPKREGVNIGLKKASEAAAEVRNAAVVSAPEIPERTARDKGTDWNDWGVLHGLDAVRTAVEAGLPPPPPPPLKPHYPAPQHTLEGAIAATKATIRRFHEDAARWVEIDHAWKRKVADVDERTPVGSPGRRGALKQARAEMAAEHGADWKTPGARVLLTSAAGMGKTTEFSSVFSEPGSSPAKVGFFSNLRKNYMDVAAKTAGATVVHGRLAPDPEAPPGTQMCLRPKAAEALMKARLQVAETLCAQGETKCEHFEKCGYQREQRRIAAGDFNIFCGAHEHLTTPAMAMRDIDVAVADEGFIEKLAGHLSFGLDRLLPTAMDNYQRAGWRLAEEFRRIMALVKAAVVDPAGNLAGLRSRGITQRKHLKPAIDYITKVEEDAVLEGVGPRTPDDVLIERVGKFQKTELGSVRKMLIALRDELHLPRDHAHGVAFVPDEVKEVDGTKERQSRVHVFYMKELAIPSRVPFLAMDGSGNPKLLIRALGERLKHVDARCERNVLVTKVIDTPLPRSALTGRDKHGKELNSTSADKAEVLQEKVAAIANGLAARHDGPFFAITNMPVEEALKPRLDPGILTGHFAGVRGSNNYEHCVAGGNFGREQTPPLAPEAIARALFSDDPEPLNLTGTYVKEVRGIRMRDGSAVPVEVWVHPDPRVQAVVELSRERELEQDLDRLRVIHNAETKHWYDVCNVPTDVTVDRVVTFNELLHEVTGRLDNGRQGKGRRFYGGRLAEAFRRGNGVLPSTPAELVRLSQPGMPFDGMWGSERAARDDLPPADVRVRTLQIDLIGKSAPLAGIEVRYRRPGQPGSPIPALIASDTRDRAILRAMLEAVVGPVVHERFEVIPDPEPPPEPPSPPPPEPGPPTPPPSGDRRPIMLSAEAVAVATASAAITAEAVDAEVDDDADALPFEVVAEPPPLLLRRIAERTGGRPPPRAVVLALPPDPVEGASHPFTVFAMQYLAAAGSEAMPVPDG